MTKQPRRDGVLALLGGGEWTDGYRALDEELLEASGGTTVVVLPTAAAFEHAGRVVERAATYFESLGASVVPLMAIHRTEAEDAVRAAVVKEASFVYLSDGSPPHLRSVLKDSALFAALVHAWHRGAVVAASGAGATVVCDPMVDPRGGAYTVGLGLVADLAIFPYHGSAADHLRARSLDLLPKAATLVGVDEHTALVRTGPGAWQVRGSGVATVYRHGAQAAAHTAPDTVDLGER